MSDIRKIEEPEIENALELAMEESSECLLSDRAGTSACFLSGKIIREKAWERNGR